MHFALGLTNTVPSPCNTTGDHRPTLGLNQVSATKAAEVQAPVTEAHSPTLHCLGKS